MSEQDGGIWYGIGTAIGMAVTGAAAWFHGRHKSAVNASEAGLEVSANDLGAQANAAVARAITRLDSEIQELQADIRRERAERLQEEREARERERRLRQYIEKLIHLLRTNAIEIPEYETSQPTSDTAGKAASSG